LKDTRGLNTRGSGNRGDQGRTESEFRGNRGSMEFRWRRGSVREEKSEQGKYKRRKWQDRKGTG